MREIKFRGISQYSGKMVYGQLLRGDNNFSIVIDFGMISTIQLEPIVKGTQSQYTGLKDENGRGIYDGDIIKGLNRLWGVVVVENVHYWNGCYMFGNYNAHEFLNKHQHIEVIGNIYENKELLEGAE